jgi:hypothetical protein
MPPPPVLGAQVQQQHQQQLDLIAQAYTQTDDLFQWSNQWPEEHREGILQRQQVERIQLHGNMPQDKNLTNGDRHRQENIVWTSCPPYSQ